MDRPHGHYADFYVKDLKDVPSGEHWAILTIENVHIPGDERSRQAPGHGYPERTESFVSYAAYLHEADFKAALSKTLENRWSLARGIHVTETFSGRTVVQVEIERS